MYFHNFYYDKKFFFFQILVFYSLVISQFCNFKIFLFIILSINSSQESINSSLKQQDILKRKYQYLARKYQYLAGKYPYLTKNMLTRKYQ